MINILADHSLPKLLEAFPAPFHLTTYQQAEELPKALVQQNILLCRSTLSLSAEFFQQNQAALNELRYIATASSGSDHLNQADLKNLDLLTVDAKGSNARAVADYVLACLAFLIKEKQQTIQSVGILGVGAVGSKVAERLRQLQLEVHCYDPPRERRDPRFKSCKKERLFNCDLLCLHTNLHQEQEDPSFHLIDSSFLEKLKPKTSLLNAARGKVVCEQALLQKLEESPSFHYCTDVYEKEPQLNRELLAKATLCTPHVAGHSLEAKERAVAMVSQKLHQAYGLTLPAWVKNWQKQETKEEQARYNTKLASFYQDPQWLEKTLAFYNPFFETKALKEGLEPAKAFLHWRQAHHRHELFSDEIARVQDNLSHRDDYPKD